MNTSSVPGHLRTIHFLVPHRIFPPGITCLDALWELWEWELNPVHDKVGMNPWLFSPCYGGHCRLFSTLYNLYFIKFSTLFQLWQFWMASGDGARHEAQFDFSNKTCTLLCVSTKCFYYSKAIMEPWLGQTIWTAFQLYPHVLHCIGRRKAGANCQAWTIASLGVHHVPMGAGDW